MQFVQFPCKFSHTTLRTCLVFSGSSCLTLSSCWWGIYLNNLLFLPHKLVHHWINYIPTILTCDIYSLSGECRWCHGPDTSHQLTLLDSRRGGWWVNFRLRGTPSALNTIKAECDRKLGDFAFKIKAVPRGTPLFIVWGLCVVFPECNYI